jgi:hypothetical protein
MGALQRPKAGALALIGVLPRLLLLGYIFLGERDALLIFYRSLEGRPFLAALAASALLTNLVVYVRTKSTAITQILHGTGLCGKCFICLRPPSLLVIRTPPLHLYQCIRVYSKLILTGKGGGDRANQREG